MQSVTTTIIAISHSNTKVKRLSCCLASTDNTWENRALLGNITSRRTTNKSHSNCHVNEQ